MILTDDFVFLHNPKTGGTFVTEVLEHLLVPSGRQYVNQYKHGDASNIPLSHSLKPVITNVRNPFDHYASLFHFGYWINRQVESHLTYFDQGEMARRFPNYPYLTFPEFLNGVFDFGNQYLPVEMREVSSEVILGPLTVRMLQYSVPNCQPLLQQLAVDKDLAPLKRQVARTRFLHTESLNFDMYRWLGDLGFRDSEVSPVLFKAPVRPANTPNGEVLKFGHGQPRNHHWSEIIDDHSRKRILRQDWLFFQLFPEYSWVW